MDSERPGVQVTTSDSCSSAPRSPCYAAKARRDPSLPFDFVTRRKLILWVTFAARRDDDPGRIVISMRCSPQSKRLFAAPRTAPRKHAMVRSSSHPASSAASPDTGARYLREIEVPATAHSEQPA